MAKTEDTKAYDPNELVDYMAPLLPGGKQRDIFCAVNGETCCIKRGVPVKIKRKFYDNLMNAQQQQREDHDAEADQQLCRLISLFHISPPSRLQAG